MNKLPITLFSLLCFVFTTTTLFAQGLTSAPNSFQFALTPVGQNSAAQNFTINNPSNNAVTISEIRFSGLNPEDFNTTLTTPVTINAQGSQVLSVVFSPQDDSPDIRSAIMEIVNNGAITVVRVPLLGSTRDNNPNPNAIRINAGANPGKTIVYNGAAWTWDKFVSGGGTFFSPQSIDSTTYDSLFYWEHIGPNFSYDIPVTGLNANSYTVELHFAEIFFDNPNQRVMDVSIEGQLVLDDFDIVAEVGTRAAIVKKFEIGAPGDNVISIAFSAVKDQAKISAIRIVPQDQVPQPTANFSFQAGATPFSIDFDGRTSSSPSGPITSYFWEFGDGTTGAGAQINHIYPAPGNYTVKLTVQDGAGTQASITQSVAVSDPNQQAIRINTGGFGVNVNGNVWLQDQFFTGGGTFGTDQPIAGTTADTLYKTEHFGEFSYNIPVGSLPGETLELELHFAEIFFTSVGRRIFDVSVEGNLLLDDFDIVATGGSFTAVIITDTIPKPADNVVTIAFTSVRDNPKISAIKIAGIVEMQPNLPPEANFQAVAAAGARSVRFDATTSTDSDGSIASYTWQLGDGGIADGQVFSYVYNDPGTYVAQLIVTDDQGAADTLSQTLVITDPDPNPRTMRINAGGDAITLWGNEWMADQFFEEGSVFTNPNLGITNTLLDPIYQTLRTGSFSYHIPVDTIDANLYQVELLFSELVFSTPAARIFDVTIEGEVALNNFDIVATDGASSAYSQTFMVDVPEDDTLSISFLTILDLPVLNGIVVTPSGSTPREPNLGEQVHLSVYPNPVQGESSFFLKAPGITYSTLNGQLINAQGQRLHTFTWNTFEQPYEIPMKAVSPGIYHVLLTTPDGQQVARTLLVK